MNISALPILAGIVTFGRGLGQKFGFPTANIYCDNNINLTRGVYLCDVFTESGGLYHAIANIGVCPSVAKNGDLRAEFHLLDFSGSLYQTKISAKLIKFLRAEKKFSSEAELKSQVMSDIQAAREYFSSVR